MYVMTAYTAHIIKYQLPCCDTLAVRNVPHPICRCGWDGGGMVGYPVSQHRGDLSACQVGAGPGACLHMVGVGGSQ